MNKEKKYFYITTTLPYVNSDPHVGFAMELIRADAIARFKKQQGYDVFFNTGTDEHGQKIQQKAEEQSRGTQEYVDEYAAKFRGLKEALGILDDVHFIRTTDAYHMKAAQEFWKVCDANGFIYKKPYKIKYCVGCELEKTESELDENGRCLLHPNLEIELIDEENYFFKWSEFQGKLLEFYDAHPGFVVPESRFNEIRKFVKRGLEDFSISRLKEKMSWGVPVPDDEAHVMYVWFDALVNYISTLGWPDNLEKFEAYWKQGETVQYAGKDNLRQQSAMWQAMLMAAGLPPTKRIVVEGFITSGGTKMSKSLGNVINPYDVVAEYGTDAFRYYCLRELSPFEDSDMTMDKFKESYNANLANGLGNLVNRVMKMAETNLDAPIEARDEGFSADYKKAFENFNIQEAANIIWARIGEVDKTIQELQPFKLVKDFPLQAKEIIGGLVQQVYSIGKLLEPFMPETSAAIFAAIDSNKMPEKPLFMRKD